jgi:phage gp16-like protein
LAKVHIAIKDLGIDDDLYRFILREEFGVESSTALSTRELEQLVARFESKGWRPQSAKGKERGAEAQVEALREKAGQMVLHTDMTLKRWRALVKSICGVEDLRWCGEAVKLKRLLVVVGNMIDRGDIKDESGRSGNRS